MALHIEQEAVSRTADRSLRRPGADPEAASARRLTRIFEALVRLTLRRAFAALTEAPRPAERAA